MSRYSPVEMVNNGSESRAMANFATHLLAEAVARVSLVANNGIFGFLTLP